MSASTTILLASLLSFSAAAPSRSGLHSVSNTNALRFRNGPICSIARRLSARAEGGSDIVAQGLKVANPVTALIKPIMAPLAKIQAGSYNKVAIQATIDNEVRSNPVVVYSYALSPFCTKAVEILKATGASVKVVDMGAEWLPGLISSQGAAIRAQLGEMTGRTSMPHVFIGGKSIGGLVDGTPGLLPLLEQGKLVDELKDAGAL